MELRSDPEMKTNLHEERMFFWEKMLWQEKERAVSRKILFLMGFDSLMGPSITTEESSALKVIVFEAPLLQVYGNFVLK